MRDDAGRVSHPVLRGHPAPPQPVKAHVEELVGWTEHERVQRGRLEGPRASPHTGVDAWPAAFGQQVPVHVAGPERRAFEIHAMAEEQIASIHPAHRTPSVSGQQVEDRGGLIRRHPAGRRRRLAANPASRRPSGRARRLSAASPACPRRRGRRARARPRRAGGRCWPTYPGAPRGTARARSSPGSCAAGSTR